MNPDSNTNFLQKQLERLDLTTEIDSTSFVLARFVPAAGKVRYMTKKRGSGLGHPSSVPDPDRNQRTAKKRAIRTMQEIARANKLNWFVTLTFAIPQQVETARKKWGQIIRRKSLKPFGHYVIVAEHRTGETTVHFHLLTKEESAQNLKTHWTYGYVDIRHVSWDEIDYVCAYMGKDFANINRPRGNRYYASRGIKPAVQTIYLTSEIRLYDYLIEAADGSEITSQWTMETGLGKYGEVTWNPHKEPSDRIDTINLNSNHLDSETRENLV